MKTLFTFVIISLCCVSMYALGWSTDSMFPTPIVNGPGEQVMPKLAIDSSGHTYLSYFDNSGGNYNVWIQRMDIQGFFTFPPPNGLLVSSHASDTWLTDYDLCVDQGNNALVTFQDIRNVCNNVIVYKITPDTEMPWGNDGIALSSDTNTTYANYSPKILNTSDNSTYVAWMRTGDTSGEIRMQRLNSSGQLLWAAGGISFVPLTGNYTWPQMLESSDGSILVKYYLDTGPYWSPTRHIYVMKLNPQGEIIWNNPISVAGGISAWNQIIGYESDGSGGAVLAWYDDRNADNINEIYVSRITSDGTVSTTTNGSLITTDTGNQQYYPAIAVDPVQENIFVFYKFTDAAQNNSGLAAQRLDFSGNRFWGESGLVSEVMSAYVASPQYAALSELGVTCVYFYGTEPSSDTNLQLRARCFRTTGANAWTEDYKFMASNVTPKLHYDFDSFGNDWIAGIWEEGFSGYDIYAMRLNSDGSLGMFYPAPTNLTAVQNGEHSMLLEWTAPAIDLVPTNYQITINDTENITIDGDITNYTMTDLPLSTYTVYVKALYNGEHYSAASNIVTITIVANSDEAIPAVAEQLQISPNPARNMATVKWYGLQASPVRLSVYNLKGQKLESRMISNPTKGWNETHWNCDNYAQGIYFLRMETGKSILTKKVVIQG